jgi:hypothetical protein
MPRIHSEAKFNITETESLSYFPVNRLIGADCPKVAIFANLVFASKELSVHACSTTICCKLALKLTTIAFVLFKFYY